MELMGIVHDLLDRYHTVLGQTLVGILTETGAQMWLSQDYKIISCSICSESRSSTEKSFIYENILCTVLFVW